MMRAMLLLPILTMIVACTPKETSSASKSNKAAANGFACASEAATYCSKERGPILFTCLKKIPQASISEACQKHLTDLPVQVKKLEDKFIENCKSYFAGCEGTQGDSNYNRHKRRDCIAAKLSNISPECKSATEAYLKILPAEWKPKI